MVKETVSKRTDGDKKQRTKRKQENYSTYILRVLKQIYPDMGISKKGMFTVNSFVQDTFENMALEAAKLVRYSKKETLGAREIESAFKLILPPDLAEHAVDHGSRAVKQIRGENK